MTTRNLHQTGDRASDEVIRPNVPGPGSPLQSGAAGNPYGAPMRTPERQPIDSNAADRQRKTSEQAVQSAFTGNEDPGSEVEMLQEERERAGRHREQP